MTPNDDDKIDWDAFVILTENGVDPVTSAVGSLKDSEPEPSSSSWAWLAALFVCLLVILWLIV